MKYTIQMASGGIMYVPGLITIGSGIRVILRVLPQHFERYSVGITDEWDL
jgi:hypothetical protein